MSINNQVRSILRDLPDGMTSRDIARRLSTGSKRESMSSELSAMVSQGIICRYRGAYRLVSLEDSYPAPGNMNVPACGFFW